MQIVNVLVGPPGSGKSHFMRERVFSQPGLYLVAVPTTWLADEQHGDYAAASPRLRRFLVHHDNKQLGSVERQFEAAREEISDRGIEHAVIFITHSSLLKLDLTDLVGWHALIDEVPNTVRSGTFEVPVSADYFANRYDLEPCGRTGWSSVRPRMKAVPWQVSQRDMIAAKIAEFDQQARCAHGLLVKSESWDGVANRGVVDWVSIWTPRSLEHFASVTMAGAGLKRSLGYRAAAALKLDVEFNPVLLPARQRGSIPTLRLHYFVEAHRGSTTFWKTPEGRRVLAPIRQYLGTLPELGFWSGNGVIQEQFDTTLPRDRFVKPKVAGLNCHTHQTSCAFIYSAQALAEDAPLVLFGLTRDDIEQSREFEDLYQFVMRGRLRDPSFSGVFDAYVYSRAQAEQIASRVAEDGVATVELVEHPEVGVMDVIRAKSRPAPSPEEREAKVEARRNRDRLRKKEARASAARVAGRTGKPGRPLKSPMNEHPDAG